MIARFYFTTQGFRNAGLDPSSNAGKLNGSSDQVEYEDAGNLNKGPVVSAIDERISTCGKRKRKRDETACGPKKVRRIRSNNMAYETVSNFSDESIGLEIQSVEMEEIMTRLVNDIEFIDAWVGNRDEAELKELDMFWQSDVVGGEPDEEIREGDLEMMEDSGNNFDEARTRRSCEDPLEVFVRR